VPLHNHVGGVEQGREDAERGHAPRHDHKALGPLRRRDQRDDPPDGIPDDAAAEEEGGKEDEVPLHQVPVDRVRVVRVRQPEDAPGR
jgi:hypothetical protein